MNPPPKPPGKFPPRGPMAPPPIKPAQPTRPGAAPAAASGRPLPGKPGAAASPVRSGTALPPKPDSPAGVERTARVAAAGATGTVGGVIEAVKLVDEVLAEENQVLRRHDAAGARALQERKLAATRLYHERMRALGRDPAAMKALSREERAELVGIAKALDERVRENAILLKATMDSIDRLFSCINQAAQQKAKREVSYSRAGMVAPSAAPAAASIAFNQTV